jgi:type IV pilus assembly protein PilA
MLKRWMKNQKGFTLVELLAVIVILGIIAAIAVPAIGHIINNTNKKADVSDAIQIINAAKLYVASEGLNTIEEDKQLGLDDLGQYLDHVKSYNKNFKVTLTVENDKISYSISGVKANGETINNVQIPDDASEEVLLKALGKDISEAGSSSGGGE